MRRVRRAMLAVAALVFLGSCGGDEKGLLERVFDIEGRASKNAPPSTVKELEDGIARYGDEVEKTVKAMEKVGTYWRLLSVRYLEKGLYGDAYDAALKALGHYPDSSGLYYVAGLSAAFLSKTSALEPGGGAAARASWLSTSEAAYRQSLKIDPKNSKSLYGLAVLYTFELEDHEAALPPIEGMLAIDPMNVDALFVYARALYGSGRLQESADAYDKIVSSSRIAEKREQAAANKKRVLDELYGD